MWHNSFLFIYGITCSTALLTIDFWIFHPKIVTSVWKPLKTLSFQHSTQARCFLCLLWYCDRYCILDAYRSAVTNSVVCAVLTIFKINVTSSLWDWLKCTVCIQSVDLFEYAQVCTFESWESNIVVLRCHLSTRIRVCSYSNIILESMYAYNCTAVVIPVKCNSTHNVLPPDNAHNHTMTLQIVTPPTTETQYESFITGFDDTTLWTLKQTKLRPEGNIQDPYSRLLISMEITEISVKFIFTKISVKSITNILKVKFSWEFIFEPKMIIFGSFNPKVTRKSSFSDQNIYFYWNLFTEIYPPFKILWNLFFTEISVKLKLTT